MMKLKLRFFTILFLLVCSMLHAQIKSYSHKRTLDAPTDLWHSVELPNTIYSKLNKDLTDIRIYGITKTSDTIEAPYILKIDKDLSERKAIPFTIINKSKTDKGFYYTFQLDADAVINEITPQFKTSNFDWQIKLEGSQNQSQWFTIIDDYRILSIKNKHTSYKFSTLNFPKAKYKYFRLFVPSAVDPELISAPIKIHTKTQVDLNAYSVKKLNIKEDKIKNTTVVDVELNHSVPINYVKLNITENHEYFRNLSVSYLADSIKTEKGWKYNYYTIHHNTISSLDSTAFNLKGTIAKKLRFKIYNADNAPLTIKTINVKGYKRTLIARFDESATYNLVYGNTSAYQPNYDIVKFKNRIPKNLKPLQLGAEVDIFKTTLKSESPFFTNKYWLWGLMLITILILGVFTLKLLKPQ